MLITPIYASVLALIFIALSARTIILRRKNKIAVGDGGNSELLKAMRAHSNFAEYVPLTLLLIYMLETSSNNPLWVHVLCIMLTVGRLVHAYGISQAKEDYRIRTFGMAMTFTALGSTALRIIISGIMG